MDSQVKRQHTIKMIKSYTLACKLYLIYNYYNLLTSIPDSVQSICWVLNGSVIEVRLYKIVGRFAWCSVQYSLKGGK